MPRNYRHIHKEKYSISEICRFLKYLGVDITVMFLEWASQRGIYRWLKKSECAKMNAAKPTGIVEYIYGLKENEFIVTLKQY